MVALDQFDRRRLVGQAARKVEIGIRRIDRHHLVHRPQLAALPERPGVVGLQNDRKRSEIAGERGADAGLHRHIALQRFRDGIPLFGRLRRRGRRGGRRFRLRRRIGHGVDHEVEAQRHDMRTDHAAFLVHSAGTVRNDRTVVQHLHLHGHGPAVGQSNLARDHMVEIVPVRLDDAPALRDGHGLPKAGVAAPVDQGLEGKVGRCHS